MPRACSEPPPEGTDWACPNCKGLPVPLDHRCPSCGLLHSEWLEEMGAPPRNVDIRRDGHSVTGGADALLAFPRIEMTGGKLFNSDNDRLYVLALLLESVGIDAAVRLGPPELWRAAVAQLPLRNP